MSCRRLSHDGEDRPDVVDSAASRPRSLRCCNETQPGHSYGCCVVDLCNKERLYEALDVKCPAEVYQPSQRVYTGLPDIDCPLHDKTILVTRCGHICIGKKKISFSTVFAGQAVGIKEVHDDIWLVSFMEYDLGYFDLETRVLENPFGPKVLPILGTLCTHVSGPDPGKVARPRRRF